MSGAEQRGAGGLRPSHPSASPGSSDRPPLRASGSPPAGCCPHGHRQTAGQPRSRALQGSGGDPAGIPGLCVCPAPCACARCVCPGRASDVTLSRRSSRSPGAPPGEISPLLASPRGVLGMYVGFLCTPLPWGAGLGHALPLSSHLPLSQAPPVPITAWGRTGGSPRAPPSFPRGGSSVSPPLSHSCSPPP